MAVTAASFKLHYPEFVMATDTVVTQKIADAATLITEDVFGTKTDHAVELHVAQAIALSPFGRSLKMSEAGKTAYDERLALLRVIVGGAVMVV